MLRKFLMTLIILIAVGVAIAGQNQVVLFGTKDSASLIVSNDRGVLVDSAKILKTPASDVIYKIAIGSVTGNAGRVQFTNLTTGRTYAYQMFGGNYQDIGNGAIRVFLNDTLTARSEATVKYSFIQPVKVDTSGKLVVTGITLQADSVTMEANPDAHNMVTDTDGSTWKNVGYGTSDLNLPVNVKTALPAGTNNIGDVDIASALPAGSNNIGSVNVANMTGYSTEAKQDSLVALIDSLITLNQKLDSLYNAEKGWSGARADTITTVQSTVDTVILAGSYEKGITLIVNKDVIFRTNRITGWAGLFSGGSIYIPLKHVAGDTLFIKAATLPDVSIIRGK